MAKGHSLRGGCVVIPQDAKAWASLPMLAEHSEPEESSQAVAVCGESRMHGHNGGDGKTQSGCASCPYPLRRMRGIVSHMSGEGWHGERG
jgi:hypothetical protein